MSRLRTTIHRRRFLGLTALAGAVAATPSMSPRAARTAVAAATATPAAGTLAAAITETMRSLAIPGANVLVGRPGVETWTVGFGVGDLQSNAPMHPQMHMRIGSITKTMTATIVLQLVDEGSLSLDDTLACVLPTITKIPNAERITVRQLLSMTSGVFDYLKDKTFFPRLLSDPARAWTPEEMIEISSRHAPDFAPGADFRYSNTNYTLLGMIIERLTKQPFAAALERRIFSPLGMAQTSLPNSPALPSPFARGYGYVPNLPSASRATPKSTDGGSPRDLTALNASVAWAEGGVVSTIGDLQIWLKALIEGSLISDRLQRERLAFRPVHRKPGAPSYGYGLGIANDDGLIGHDGDILGYQSIMGRLAKTGEAIIVLANLSPTKDGSDAADAVARAIRRVLAATPAAIPRALA